MRHRIIHLINPKTDSLTTRPLYLNRALYSPLAGLLAVAGAIPRDRYEVVLTDENIESIDYDLETDLVGISAMKLNKPPVTIFSPFPQSSNHAPPVG